uniref:RBR-type E3 ubiquitin transferase n=1 Tax=Tanacetum cinerariifolium TaxID=118510 RepID=A0A699IX10_TANCI|nr:probable E3 ubiquitin-protein ligase RNF217 [Tanacetum cinerariifolium]
MGDLIPQENPNQYDDEDTFTCEIYFELASLPNKRFINNNRCVHSFCTACMIKYIQAKLVENVSDVKCPHESCNHSLEPLSCGNKISHKLFNRWCDTLCESTVLDFDLVYCPNNECSELNEFSDGDVKRCVCLYCLEPFCYQCKAPWHDGYTCEETRGMETMWILKLFARRMGGIGRGVPSVGIIFSLLVVVISLIVDVGLNFAISADKKYHFGTRSSFSICVAQPMTITMRSMILMR